jgi:hypothetical protein
LALTDPKDVARVESRTFISTTRQIDTISTPKHGFKQPPPEINLPNLKCTELGTDLYLNFEFNNLSLNHYSKKVTGCRRKI